MMSGWKVYLAIGGAGRVPRRYRGRDIADWFTRMGMFDTKVDELKSPQAKSMHIRKSQARTAARA
jgi:putative flavoprotein involved in K+ transport